MGFCNANKYWWPHQEIHFLPCNLQNRSVWREPSTREHALKCPEGTWKMPARGSPGMWSPTQRLNMDMICCSRRGEALLQRDPDESEEAQVTNFKSANITITIMDIMTKSEMLRPCWRGCRWSPATPSTLWWRTSLAAAAGLLSWWRHELFLEKTLTVAAGAVGDAGRHRCCYWCCQLLPLLRQWRGSGDEHQDLWCHHHNHLQHGQIFNLHHVLPSWLRNVQTLLEARHLLERVQMFTGDSIDSLVENSFGGNRKLALMVPLRKFCQGGIADTHCRRWSGCCSPSLLASASPSTSSTSSAMRLRWWTSRTWHHHHDQGHNNITTTSIHKIQICSIATLMKNCSDPAGEDAHGDGEGADDG